MRAALHSATPGEDALFTLDEESEILRCSTDASASVRLYEVRRIRAGRLADFSAAHAALGERAEWMFSLLTADDLVVLVAESGASFADWVDVFADIAPQHFRDEALAVDAARDLVSASASRAVAAALPPPPLPAADAAAAERQCGSERRALLSVRLPAALERLCRALDRCVAKLAEPAASDEPGDRTFRMRSSKGALRAQVRVEGAAIARATLSLNFSTSRHSSSAAVKLELRAGECWTLSQIVNSRNFCAAALALASKARDGIAKWGAAASASRARARELVGVLRP